MLYAELKNRVIAQLKIELSIIDLAEVPEQLGSDPPFFLSKLFGARDQFGRGEVFLAKLHNTVKTEPPVCARMPVTRQRKTISTSGMFSPENALQRELRAQEKAF